MKHLGDKTSAAPHALHCLVDLVRDLYALLDDVQAVLQLLAAPLAIARLLPELDDAPVAVVERVRQVEYRC